MAAKLQLGESQVAQGLAEFQAKQELCLKTGWVPKLELGNRKWKDGA